MISSKYLNVMRNFYHNHGAERRCQRYILGLCLTALLVVSHTGAVLADDRPRALVEFISNAPSAEFQAYDYVYDGDKIDLRPGGQMALAYFDTCQVETFDGGMVRIKGNGAKTSKGGNSNIQRRPCQTAALALSDDAREAGVAVKRVSPFPKTEWREVTVPTARPNFIWPKSKSGKGNATLTIIYLDASPTDVIWQAETDGHFIAYSEDAPILTPGMPYKAVVSYNGKTVASSVFSIDPELQLPSSALTSAVPLGL